MCSSCHEIQNQDLTPEAGFDLEEPSGLEPDDSIPVAHPPQLRRLPHIAGDVTDDASDNDPATNDDVTTVLNGENDDGDGMDTDVAGATSNHGSDVASDGPDSPSSESRSDHSLPSWHAAWNPPIGPAGGGGSSQWSVTDPEVIAVYFEYNMQVEMQFNPGLRYGPPRTRVNARHWSLVHANF